jgi:hypothetical protein
VNFPFCFLTLIRKPENVFTWWHSLSTKLWKPLIRTLSYREKGETGSEEGLSYKLFWKSWEQNPSNSLIWVTDRRVSLHQMTHELRRGLPKNFINCPTLSKYACVCVRLVKCSHWWCVLRLQGIPRFWTGTAVENRDLVEAGYSDKNPILGGGRGGSISLCCPSWS